MSSNLITASAVSSNGRTPPSRCRCYGSMGVFQTLRVSSILTRRTMNPEFTDGLGAIFVHINGKKIGNTFEIIGNSRWEEDLADLAKVAALEIKKELEKTR